MHSFFLLLFCQLEKSVSSCWHPAFKYVQKCLPKRFTILNNINLGCNWWLVAYCWSASARRSITWNKTKKYELEIHGIIQIIWTWNVYQMKFNPIKWIWYAFPSSFSAPLEYVWLTYLCLFIDFVRWQFNLRFCHPNVCICCKRCTFPGGENECWSHAIAHR